MNKLAFILVLFALSAFAKSDHLMVSNKDLKWVPATPALPPGAQMAILDGDPTKAGDFTIRLKFPASYRIQAHTHPADEHVTVLEGNLNLGFGDKFEASATHSMSTGDYARTTKGTKHFAMSRGPAIIQVNGKGPWGMTYVNPSDDPRTQNKKTQTTL